MNLNSEEIEFLVDLLSNIQIQAKDPRAVTVAMMVQSILKKLAEEA